MDRGLLRPPAALPPVAHPSPTAPRTPGRRPLRRTLSARGDRLEYLCAIHGSTGDARRRLRGRAGPPALDASAAALRCARPREPVAGRPVTFIASYTPGRGGARYTRFSWDLDGDGERPAEGRGPDHGPSRGSPRCTRAPAAARISVTGLDAKLGAASTSTTRLALRRRRGHADSTPPTIRWRHCGPRRPGRDPAVGARRDRSRQRAGAGADRRACTDGRVLARVTRRLGSRGPARPDAPLARAAASLRGRRDVRLRLRIVARDDAGNRTTLRKTFIVR